MKKKKSNDSLYLNLQQSFVKIRTLFYSPSVNPNKLDAVLGDLRFARKQLEKRAKRKPRKILTYCIDTLFEIIEEGNAEKIRDFADLIHNMPEIALKKRSFRSFGKEISALNIKYEEFYFCDINTIHIQISKDSIKQFFASDEKPPAPRSANDRAAVIPTIVVFLLPLICYIIYMTSLPDDRSTGAWPVLAFLGCLTVSVGLFNIIAVFFGQYLGHKLTVICLLGGSALIAISVVMIENPQLYDEKISTFYLVSLAMMLFPLIFYPIFRFSVESYVLRTKRIRTSYFRKLIKGKKNYWWYEALHKELNLGKIYYLNKTFTILYIALFTLTLFTGFIKEMSLILCPMGVLLYILVAAMATFSRIQENLKNHGALFVIFAKTRNGGFDCVLFDIFMVILALIPAWLTVLLTQNMWG